MTVIIGYTIGDVPVLLGDTLRSNTGNSAFSKEDTDIPSFDNINELLHGRQRAPISGLVQKLNFVSNACVLGWANSYIHAKAIFRELQDSERQVLQYNGIKEAIANIPPQDDPETSLIGLYRSRNETTLFYKNVQEINSDRYKENIFGAGSGIDHFEWFLSKFRTNFAGTHQSQASNDYHHAFGLAVWLAGQAMGTEILTGGNLLENWGGAIEIVIPQGGVLKKIDNVLYTFWIIDEDRKYFGMQPFFVKTYYEGDVLIVLRLKADSVNGPPRGGMSSQFEQKLFAIPPIDYTPRRVVEIDPPNFAYEIVISNVVQIRNDEPVDIATHCLPIGSKPGPVFIKSSDNRIEVGVDTEYYKEVARSAFSNFYPETPIQEIRLNIT